MMRACLNETLREVAMLEDIKEATGDFIDLNMQSGCAKGPNDCTEQY